MGKCVIFPLNPTKRRKITILDNIAQVSSVVGDIAGVLRLAAIDSAACSDIAMLSPSDIGCDIHLPGRRYRSDQRWKMNMDMERTRGNPRQTLKRYRTAALLGCTALVALAPGFASA